MALIKCADCNSDVSDSAKACPNCGAPIERVLKEDETHCPFCHTILKIDATVCPSCDAKKGYATAKGEAYGKGKTIFWGIIVPGVLLVYGLIAIFSGEVAAGLLMVIIFSIPAVFSIYRLKTGPVWYKSRNIT